MKKVDNYEWVAYHFFFWTGITLDFFHIHGKVPVLKLLLNIIDKGFNKAESPIFIILMEISSWPCALLMFKALIIFDSILIIKNNWEKSLISTKNKLTWHSLPLLSGVYWQVKNSLNLLAFSLKSETSLPSIKRGGMTGIFLPLKIVFRIDQ